MSSSLRQPRLPVVETWIEELLREPDEQSQVELVDHDARDPSEPILASCMRPRASNEGLLETLRPTGDSQRPSRASDPSELSPLLEGDELDLLRFGVSA
ncbi:MAG TPA: hypothetical protein VFZ61_04725 [Polyangiales bacterium]